MTGAKATKAVRRFDGAPVAMSMSGFCAYTSPGSHGYCHESGRGSRGACDCPCHVADEAPSSEGFDTSFTPVVLAPAPAPTNGHAKVRGVRVQVSKNRPGQLRTAGVAAEPKKDDDGRLLEGPTVIVEVTHLFYDDHVSRGLPSGFLVRRLDRKSRIELDAAGYDDLLADAQHYVSGGTEEFEGYGGLIASARSIVRALEKVGRPQ